MRACVLALALVVFGHGDVAAQSAFAGTWRVEGVNPPGIPSMFPLDIVIRIDGTAVSGMVSSCPSPQPPKAITDGRIEGDRITFQCSSAGARVVSFAGGLSGGTLRLTWTVDGPVAAANAVFGAKAPKELIATRVPDGELAKQAARLIAGSEFAVGVNLPEKDTKVEARLFIPASAARVRAVIVVTGWGLGFDFVDAAQARRLAESTQSGLLLARTTSISTQAGYGDWNDASIGGADALILALQRLAQEFDHPEVANAPLVIWGQSAGAGFGTSFAALHPDRTAAVVRYQSGAGVAARDLETVSRIPMLMIVAGKDSPALLDRAQSLWRDGRSLGAPWTFAEQPDAEHGEDEALGRACDLMVPWITAVLIQRLPPSGTALRPVGDAGGWLGHLGTREISPFTSFTGAKTEASWLPDEATARRWRELK
jgi:dienelactone hydrolase